MLSTQADLVIQTDILPTQNIALLDQNQPQVYSILASSNSHNSAKKSRRKKPTKLDETMPVMLNPQITRTSTGIAFTAPHYRSTSMPEPISSFVPTRAVDDHRLPFRLCLDPNSYDANNNINNNQILPLSRTLNPSLPTQVPRCSSPVVNRNSIPQLVTKSQLVGVNHLFNNNMNERIMSVPSLQQNEHNYLQSSYTLPDQGSRSRYSPSIPSSMSPIFISDLPPIKSKRKYSKRQNVLASVDQQQFARQTSSCPTTFTQPNVSNGLPSVIPSSLQGTAAESEEHPLPLNIPTTPSSFVPLTPPGSIKSMKSPPTNMINELTLIPVRQHLLPFTTTNVAEINPISKQYFPAQRLAYSRKTITNSPICNGPYHLDRFMSAAYAQYCMVPSNLITANILPMTSPPMLPEVVTNNPSVSIVNDMEKERPQEKSTRKVKVMQTPTIEKLRDDEYSTSELLTTDISTLKKRKHKSSSTKDIRTKKQLRRISRQNRLAVLKFMIRKRKQQRQQPVSIPLLADTKVAQIKPSLTSTPTVKLEEMETNLPDIIAPSLKISFDATQKIESISLYYHRRCKPNTMDEKSSTSPIIADNRLSLLIEAAELMETMNGNFKLALSSTN